MSYRQICIQDAILSVLCLVLCAANGFVYRSVPFPVYVCEHTMPEDFVCVWERDKICKMSAADNARKTVEKLFIHERFAPNRNKTFTEPELWERQAYEAAAAADL